MLKSLTLFTLITLFPIVCVSETTLTTHEVEFELVNGLILVEANLNSKKGFFVLDTGSSDLVIHSTEKGSSSIEATGLNKSMNLGEIQIDSFIWLDSKRYNFKAAAIDLGYLIHATQKNILGLIGSDLISDYQIELNYTSQTLSFRPANHKTNSATIASPIKIPIKFKGSLPIITLQISNKRLDFALDTGSSINLLDSRLINKLGLKMNLSNGEDIKIHGIDGSVEPLKSIYIDKLFINNHKVENVKFALRELTFFNREIEGKIDGIIGAPFLMSAYITINLSDKVLGLNF